MMLNFSVVRIVALFVLVLQFCSCSVLQDKNKDLSKNSASKKKLTEVILSTYRYSENDTSLMTSKSIVWNGQLIRENETTSVKLQGYSKDRSTFSQAKINSSEDFDLQTLRELVPIEKFSGTNIYWFTRNTTDHVKVYKVHTYNPKEDIITLVSAKIDSFRNNRLVMVTELKKAPNPSTKISYNYNLQGQLIDSTLYLKKADQDGFKVENFGRIIYDTQGRPLRSFYKNRFTDTLRLSEEWFYNSNKTIYEYYQANVPFKVVHGRKTYQYNDQGELLSEKHEVFDFRK